MSSIAVAGSLDVLVEAVASCHVSSGRVCVVGTAAAFRGVEQACDDVRAVLGGDVDVTVVSGIDRRSVDDPANVATMRDADLVVVPDGAALHARALWRGSALGAALGDLDVVCVGSVGSVLGATMIDPRGGAPTTGLGLFDEVVVGCAATPEQSARSRSLLGPALTYLEVGPRSVVRYDGTWSVVRTEGLRITRGDEELDAATWQTTAT